MAQGPRPQALLPQALRLVELRPLPLLTMVVPRRRRRLPAERQPRRPLSKLEAC